MSAPAKSDRRRRRPESTTGAADYPSQSPVVPCTPCVGPTLSPASGWAHSVLGECPQPAGRQPRKACPIVPTMASTANLGLTLIVRASRQSSTASMQRSSLSGATWAAIAVTFSAMSG